MKVLGLDTSSGACSVALFDTEPDRVLASERVLIQRGHAEILFVQIARVTKAAGVGLSVIDRFAVTTGPGTFTGVRIGLSAARGLALAASRPLIGINSLETVAFGAAYEPESIVVTAFDARRDELYVQAFRAGAPLSAPFVASVRAAAEAVMLSAPADASFAVIGSGAAQLVEAITAGGARTVMAHGDPLPDAALLARLAATRVPSSHPPRPLYLRAPDARIATAL